jgi:glycogen(starch) synthase
MPLMQRETNLHMFWGYYYRWINVPLVRESAMKLLIYTLAFPPQIGGQETILMLLANGLATLPTINSGASIEVTLITPVPANGATDSALPFRVVRHPGLLSLIRLFREADIVHLAGAMMIPMILGKLLGKPIVIEHHGFQPICPNGQLLFQPTQTACPGHFMAGNFDKCIRCNASLGSVRTIRMWLLTFPRRWLCQRIAVNVLPTTWLGSLLRLKRMETIVHGLPPADLVQIGTTTSKPLFAFVGRLVTTKGVRVLLEAAQQLKAKGLEFKVKIAGQGPDRYLLEDFSRQLGLQNCVDFLGYVPPKDLSEILSKASAVVMPSLAGEVFGLSAAENMSNGKLVIASDLGSLSEVIGDSGMTFPAGDSVALGHRMEEVIENPDTIRKLGRAAHERIAEGFALENMIRDHYVLYRRLLVVAS